MYLQNLAKRNNTNTALIDKMRSKKIFHGTIERTWKMRNKEEEEDGKTDLL